MKILIDLIHPANYHYFKYFIQEMKEKGNGVVISARRKDVLQDLLLADGIPFKSSGVGKIGKGALGKIAYLFFAEFFFFMLFFREKPEIVLSFGSSPCSHNSFLFRIPHVSFDDTEHASPNRKLYAPFADFILTPFCFYLDLGRKQFRFDGYMELFYLHKTRFKPDKEILKQLNVCEDQRIILFRFVSWEAFHDLGQRGLSKDEKINLVSELSQYAKVYISSEGNLPPELHEYKLNIPVNKIHDFIAFITLYIGEGGTMASECAILGVPSIYINSLPLMGYLKEAQNHGLLYHMNETEEIRRLSLEILNDDNSKAKYHKYQENFLMNKIDPTSLLVWLIENYPESKRKLLKDPSFQNNFI